MRRVVVVTTSFPISDDDPSGHFVRTHAYRLARAGDRVDVVAPGGALGDPPAVSGPLLVHRAGGGSLFGWPGALARARAAPWRIAGAASFAVGVRARLQSIGAVDLVVAHWMVPSAFPLTLGVDAPLQVVAHGADVRMVLAAPPRLREAALASIVGRASSIAFASSSLLRALRASVSPGLARRLDAVARVEPPPIDVPDVAARAGALRSSLPHGERVLVWAGRLVPEKRLDLALAAANILNERVAARLVVIGDGPSRDDLPRSMPEVGGERVRWMGRLPRTETLAWLAAADAVVHTSAVEAAPTVVREARSLGKPVVACDAGDVALWAASDSGLVLAPANAEGIARALARVLERRESLAFGAASTSVRLAVEAEIQSSTRPGA